VTAIIIFLDEERFLEEAVRSVLAQTYTDWELLLVDDGSKDGSTAMANSFAARFPGSIRYLEHSGHANRGMSASRNLGLSQARGEYIGFLDADDVWLPSKLQQQVELLDANPAVAMIYGRTLIWNGWNPGPGTEPDFFYELGVEPDTVVPAPTLLLMLLENRYQTPTTCNAMMRRQAIGELGGFEDSFRGMFEDQVFFMKVGARHPVYVASACWAKYRQRVDSRSAAETAREVRAARRRLLDWLEEHLRRQRIESSMVARAVRTQRWALRWPRLFKVWMRLSGRGDIAKTYPR
jgi:glycosyltransferase involved in cell wall biosynthesis